jgi:peroxiredoxin family protein
MSVVDHSRALNNTHTCPSIAELCHDKKKTEIRNNKKAAKKKRASTNTFFGVRVNEQQKVKLAACAMSAKLFKFTK